MKDWSYLMVNTRRVFRTQLNMYNTALAVKYFQRQNKAFPKPRDIKNL